MSGFVAADGAQRGILRPDVSATILHPENADGYQGGRRVRTLAGAVDWLRVLSIAADLPRGAAPAHLAR